MIPLRDVIPSRTTPYITVTIILLNAVAWLFEISLQQNDLNQFLYVYGVVPAQFTWPTLITSMFLHGGWMHVIGNMWYLWIFGDNVEDRLGHAGYIVFYLLCGIVAAFGQIVIDPTSTLPTIGASGAIAGVLGAYALLYPRARVLTLIFLFVFFTFIEIPAYFFLFIWFAQQAVFGALDLTNPNGGGGGVAYFAHVGGFLFGLLAIKLFAKRRSAAYGQPKYPVY